MRVDDWCRCTPREFHAIAEAYRKGQEQTYRNGWEQTRQMCLCLLQPYSKKKLSAGDVLQFPWDKGVEHEEEEKPVYDAEAARASLERVKQLWNME